MVRLSNWIETRIREFLLENDIGLLMPLFGFGLGLALWWYFNEIPPGDQQPAFALFLRQESGMEPVLWMAGLMCFGLVTIAWRNWLMRALNLLMVTSFMLTLVGFGFETRTPPPFVILIELWIMPITVLLTVVVGALRSSIERCSQNELLLMDALERLQRYQVKEESARDPLVTESTDPA